MDQPVEQEIRFLGDLQRLDVKPGDRFVLTVPGAVSREMAMQLQEMWERLKVSDAKLIVLQEGMKLGVIGTGE